MPGISGLFKGAKAAFAKTAKGAPKGTYTKMVDGKAVATKAKPGYKIKVTKAKPGYKIKVTKQEGLMAKAFRNPKTSLAIGAAALGGAYMYSQSGSPSDAGSQTYGYA